MFGRGKRGTSPHSRIDGLIGRGVKVCGDVSFSGGLRIDGEVVGNITAVDGGSSILVLSEHGRVEGSVSVAHAILNGEVAGPLTVSESLELQAGAKVTGNVEYKSLEVRQGAVVSGALRFLGE